jgi:hypothetical protein
MVRAIREVRSLLKLPLLFPPVLPSPGLGGRTRQPSRLQDPGKGFVEVGRSWRFHTGDNLEWAQPGYDDSGWELLRGDKTWGAQTFRLMWASPVIASGLK